MDQAINEHLLEIDANYSMYEGNGSSAAIPEGAVGLAFSEFLARNNQYIMDYVEKNRSKLIPPKNVAGSASRYSNAVSRLYIIVNSIEAEGLAGPSASKSQEALSILAACPAVSLIASCDNLNCPLLWSTETSSKFNWLYINVPTFEPYCRIHEGSSIELLLSGSGISSSTNYKNTNTYYKGMTARQKDILKELIQESLKQKDAKKPAGKAGSSKKQIFGVYKPDLFTLCSQKLIVSNINELNKSLKELTEQKIVSTIAYAAEEGKAARGDFVSLLMSVEDMENFLKLF